MAYLFKGNLGGLLCDDCPEPLAGVRVRLYRVRSDQRVTEMVAANPEDTLLLLTDDQIKAKEGLLLAEAETDEAGNFTFELGEKQRYGGEAFEIDIYCGSVPRQKIGPRRPKPRQFTLTTVQPLWRERGNDLVWAWEYQLPHRFWCDFRKLFGAWVICGRIVTCDQTQPVRDLKVTAFDSDWVTDDVLGSAITDADGRFRIDYDTADFKVTSFIPLNIDTPWLGYDSGPDVYFKIETLDGTALLSETRARGLQADRSNRGPCFCVELCVEPGRIVVDPEKVPTWTKVEVFNVQPVSSDPAHNFSAEGYAGTGDQAYVFGGHINLLGNVPLRNPSIPANPVKYRFRFAEWGWMGGGDGTAGVMPTIAPPSPMTDPSAWRVVPVGASEGRWVGDIYYNDGVNPFAHAPVYISAADQDAEGFIKLDGKFVTVPMSGGGSATIAIAPSNWKRSGYLFSMNTAAITSLHPTRFPAWGSNKTNAGRGLSLAEQEPIRRYRVRFEVYDAVTNTELFVETLDSIILDNSAAVTLLNLQELLSSACNPVSGLSQVHLRYTVDHPHLRFYSVEISNNGGLVHAAPPLPRGDFTAGSFFFRGAASGPAVPSDPGGVAVNISGDPVCAYMVTLTWQTRHYQTGVGQTWVLYCK